MMKKILYIIMAAVVMASCTRTLELDRKPVDDKLNILALMHSSDTAHFVYVKVSNDQGLLTAEEEQTSVICTINGTEKIVAEPYSGLGGKFRFEAEFNPGDRVRIEAEYNGMKAWSEVVVPQPVDIELADTSRKVEIKQDEERITVLADLLIDDIVGENSYYRVGPLRHEILHIFHQWPEEDGTPRPDKAWMHVRASSLNINIGNDPILNDDYMVEGDEMVSFSPYNYFRIFSDKHFADSQAEVSVSYKENELERFYGYYFNLPEHLKETEVVSTVNIVIEHLSPEAYRYYKALNVGKMNDYDSFGGLLMEPVVIPNNVEGGIGFVDISMDSLIPIPVHHSMMQEFDGNTMVPLE